MRICNKNYKIYIPSGNPTALVEGIESDTNTIKEINDSIIDEYNGFVEQVGFVSEDKDNPELLMAGGEFCGNASRSAVYYYLDGKEGEISLKVSGIKDKLKAGIDSNKNVWVEMPIIKGNYDESIKIISDKLCIIKLLGITHIVVDDPKFNILYNDENKLKEVSFELLKKYKLNNELASGVIYLERKLDKYYIYPIVYVKSINTLFYETACGSGTTAVGLYESYLKNKSININVVQKSKEVINVITNIVDDKINGAIISGTVKIYKN